MLNLDRRPIPFSKATSDEIKEVFQVLPSATCALLGDVGSCSPFLKNLMIEYKDWLIDRISNSNDDIIGELERDLIASTNLHETLRISKAKMALWTAICDLGGKWDLDQVMLKLTLFANLVLQQSMEFEFNRNPKLKNLINVDRGIGKSGWFALAMGKMGAFELNYSSDIDLIFMFDESVYPEKKYNDIRMAFIRMSRSVNQLINETTGTGYVFRTDFRLRPNPSVTPICLSTESALGYYESAGRAWERAAFIKARPCAGDLDAGAKFLKKLQPFIWRKHLDFATIKDAHDIRQQIKTKKLNSGSNSIVGQNIKLIEGGIRDIEFFAQTKQIIAGGRDKTLRSYQTCKALKDLSKSGWVSVSDLQVLTDAYKNHRILEHRLQMVNDLQTHQIPSSEINFKRIACFLGYKNTSDLIKVIEQNISLVSKITQKFFSPSFEDVKISDNFLLVSEEWLKLPVLRSDRAKEVFRNIRPTIIRKVLNSGSPDLILKRFTKFLEGLPSGVQLFSLFAANNELIDLLLEICASGENLSSYLAKNSKVFDAVLDGDFFEVIDFDKIFFEAHEELINNGSDYEDQLLYIRKLFNELQFRVGVHYLRGIIDSKNASLHYSKLADNILKIVWFFCCQDFRLTYGNLPGNGVVLVGMGSLGARTMSADSDIDLILIYDSENTTSSNGKKSLVAPVYYSRLTKKLLTALSAKMEHGHLYRVDMRLRPSGNKGPVATSFSSYKKYQMNDAWMWERLAFLRARAICGDQKLLKKFVNFEQTVLKKKFKFNELFGEVSKIRKKIKSNHVEYNFPWDLKKGPGNMLDIELLGQSCALLLNLKSKDTFDHIEHLFKIDNWSNIEKEKISDVYLQMSKLRQILGLLGGSSDFENEEAKFVHRLVTRETGVQNMADLKESLSNLRKYASDVIDNKMNTIEMINE